VTFNSCVIFFHLHTWIGLLFIWHQDSLLLHAYTVLAWGTDWV
jgi:hypothetical protein